MASFRESSVSRRMEEYCYEKSVEASLPAPIRRVFLLVRLLKEEIASPRSHSRKELLLIAQRCENHRRGFQDVSALYRPGTKLSLVKAHFLQVWSPVAVDIYERLQSAKKAEKADGKINYSASSIELVNVSRESSASRENLAKCDRKTKPDCDKEGAASVQCIVCGDHYGLLRCRRFASSAVSEKRRVMKLYGLCYVCLQSGHSKAECKCSSSCDKCGNRHATTIHDAIKIIEQCVQLNRRHPCVCCGGKHPLYQCDDFGKLPLAGRMKFVKQHQLCVNCLHAGHQDKDCENPWNCCHCALRHHSLIHRALRPEVRYY